MNRKWIYRVVAVCTVLMLAAGSVADELPADTATPEPVVQTNAPATDAPPTQAPSTSAPAAQESEAAATDAPAETSASSDTEAPSETQSGEKAGEAEQPTSAPTENPEKTPSDGQPEETPGDADATPSAPAEDGEPTLDPSADPTLDPSVSPSPDPSLSPSPEALVIVGLAALPMTEAALEEKPALEQVLSILPAELEATLADGTTASVAVTWSCADYAAEAAEYVFTAALADPVYVLGEGVGMPVFTLRIQPSNEVVSGDFAFVRNEQGQLMLVGWTGSEGAVSIPASVDGAPVTAVAKSAFAGRTGLTEVVVPAGVAAIEEGAFENCTGLTKVNLPDSLEIAGSLFAGCGALTTLQLDISNETAMSRADGYTTRIVEIDEDGNQTVREVSVQLDREFTDYCVLSGGKWRVDGALKVKAGHSATIASGGALHIAEAGTVTVNGTLSNAGAALNEGAVIACAGNVSGVEGRVVTDHSYDGGVCTVCGARQALTLTISAAQTSNEKTYDGTSGLDLGAEDFVIEGVREGDEVYIAAINTSFNESKAGSYLANVSFQLGGASAEYYSALPMELSVVIHKKQVTVSPREGQSKVYGAQDPSLKAGYRGVVSGETLSGKLGREKGENAGKYRITAGTLEESNPNYQILLDNVNFEITPKSIEDGSITVAKIANQRYTGAALTPGVEVRDGGKMLAEGVDYELSYADNADVGSAKVTITGIGNYQGARTVGFRIIKVSSGGSTGGYGDLSGFLNALPASDGASSGAAVVETTEIRSEGNLVLGESDWGTILFNADDEPHPFFWHERTEGEDANLRRYFAVDADVCYDEWGAPIEGEYGQPRLRLTMGQINALRQAGYTDLELTVDEAQVRVPLSTLFAEYVGSESTLVAAGYEVRLWPLDEDELEAYEAQALEDRTRAMKPCHFELLALPQEGAVNADGTAVQPEDVLSLLDGVVMLLVPEEEPDYLNVAYSVVRAEMDDPEVVPAPEGATFIMENETVKCVLTPLYGGMYALARD